MRAFTRISLGIVAAVALSLAGCAARAKNASATPAALKPAAPVAPPPPVALSTPQTNIQLPKPQPIDDAAWETVPPATPDTAAKPPAAPPPRTIMRPPRTEPAPTPPVATAETVRPQFQEVISESDKKKLQDSVANRRREVDRILEQVQKRQRLTQPQKNTLGEIRGLMKLCDDYEKRNEWPQADTMAERAQILAKQLVNGK
jgi:hypothetical protein